MDSPEHPSTSSSLSSALTPDPSSPGASQNDASQSGDHSAPDPSASSNGADHPSPPASTSADPESLVPKLAPKKKAKTALPAQLPEPLPALPSSTKLPDLEDFNLRPEQVKNPLFVAICKVLIIYGNAWQSATDLVDGVRHFRLASLGGQTPKGTIQGAISTGLALAAALGTFDPIEKQRMHSTTYYRMDPRALEPPSSDAMDSDATDAGRRILNSRAKGSVTNARRKTKSHGASKSKKRKIASAWDTDTMSSDTSDDDDDSASHSNGHSTSSAKRARTGSPSTKSRPTKPEVPNGLKKLPKGYVYDTEINQSALMNLSVNPSQTGEYMEHLKGQQALENNYPDRRSEYGVDLSQEPSMFAVEQQTGYTYPRLRTSGRERLPKPDCEDGYAVADLKHSGGFLGRLFCITDGHGGRACSSFVIATIPGAMQVILGKYKPSDLSVPSIQELVKNQITEAIRVIDKEYLDYKKQQYLLYKAKKIPHDPGSDGTTLIVNIFIDKWMICVNVGDSRSIISSRDTAGRWNVDFYSEDHTPSLERLAQTIYANGGEFVTHDDKVIKFDPNLKNDKKHRQSLKEARIRVKDGASNLYGIPYRTRNGQAASINLGACIGDVLYKLDTAKPVLSCKPDITFIDITTIQHGYLLMASDGLWDYVLRGGKVQEQNAAVSQFVGDKLDRGWNHQRIVSTLSDRENMSGLYSDSIQEYDDFTAILVTISNQHLVDKEQEQQMQKERIRQHEVALLQQQQLQMRRELEEEEQKKEGEGLLSQSQEGVRLEAQTSNGSAKDESIDATVAKLQDSDQPAEQDPEDTSKVPSELTLAMDVDEDGPDAAPESASSEIDIDDSAVEQEASSSEAGDLNIVS